MKVFFVYAGRRGSNLECAIALHSIAKRMKLDSHLILSSDNSRAKKVRRLYPDAEFVNFFSPSGLLALRKKLSGGVAFFTMISPKMVPLFLSLRSPKVFYFHATYDYSISKKKARDVYYDFLHDLLIKNSTVVAATQDGLANQIQKRLRVKVAVLPHPPYSPINPMFFSDEKKVKLPFGKGEYYFNFGEISRDSKGTGLLLHAVAGTSIPLVLAGHRKGVPKGKNIAHLDRWVSDGQLHWLIKNSRCSVLPYLLKSQFSGCLALSFHFKKPVLAPYSPVFSNLVEEGKTGWLFAHGDSKSLREKMEKLQKNARFSPSSIAEKEHEMEAKTRHALLKILSLAIKKPVRS